MSDPTIKSLLKDIYKKLEGYVSAQVIICLVLGAFYSILFLIIDLPSALIFGFLLGALNLIPYLGALIGFLISVFFGLFYSDGYEWIALVGAFIVGQFIESYYLTPKLVGNKTGLHPFVVFLSILLGGALFGILGMIVAVPIAIIAFSVLRHIRARKVEKTDE